MSAQPSGRNVGDDDTAYHDAVDVHRILQFAALHGLDFETARLNLNYSEEFDKITKSLLMECVLSNPSTESLNLRYPELIPDLVRQEIAQIGKTSISKTAEVGCQARAQVNQGTSMTPPPELELNSSNVVATEVSSSSVSSGDMTFNMNHFYSTFDAKSFAENFKKPKVPTMPPPEAYSSMYCPFCRKNGENEEIYKGHNLTDPITKAVICPVLAAYVCKFCGASGGFAHTATYCPLNTSVGSSRKTSSSDFSDWASIGHWEG